MKIVAFVKVKAKENKVKRIDENNFSVAVKEAPERGRANDAIIKSFADYFHATIADIKIISGRKSKKKIIQINKK